MAYTQLTQEQRNQIYALKKMGHSQGALANCLEVHIATISRELKRNTGQRSYRPKQAHQKALQRRQGNSSVGVSPTCWAVVEEKLRQDWSPEQIAGWLRKKHPKQVRHERIYQYVYADKKVGAPYISTCVVRKSDESDMAPASDGAKSVIASVLSSGPKSSPSASGWATGKEIR